VHIRQYQAAMFREWRLAPNTVTHKLAALRFFYVQVLKRGWSVAETPYPKKVLHLPQVLSPPEVALTGVAKLGRMVFLFYRRQQDLSLENQFGRCLIL
jgi:site-specific recombinase XerD